MGCCIAISRLRKTCWSLSYHCQLDPFGICQNQGYQQKESGRTRILKSRLFCYCWLDFLQGEMGDSQSEDSMTVAQISASTRVTTEPFELVICLWSRGRSTNRIGWERVKLNQTWIAMTCKIIKIPKQVLTQYTSKNKIWNSTLLWVTYPSGLHFSWACWGHSQEGKPKAGWNNRTLSTRLSKMDLLPAKLWLTLGKSWAKPCKTVLQWFVSYESICAVKLSIFGSFWDLTKHRDSTKRVFLRFVH